MKTSPLIPSTLLKLSSSKVKGEKVGIPDQAVSTYSGDWDLHLEPINEFGATCNQNLDNYVIALIRQKFLDADRLV
jgi:hypothetical protein